MDCKTVSNYIVDYIDGELDKSTFLEIEKHLKECTACNKEYNQTHEVFLSIENMPLKKPNPQLKASFEQLLAKEKAMLGTKNQTIKTFRLTNYKILWQVAAAILLLVSGYLAGYNSSVNSSNNNQVLTMQNDIAEMKQQMQAISLLKNESASQRIKAVNYTEEIQKPSNETIEALINTLKTVVILLHHYMISVLKSKFFGIKLSGCHRFFRFAL